MKVYFRGMARRLPWFTSMEPFLRFALTHPVTTAVIGCDNLMHLAENVELARSFKPMHEEEMRELIEMVSPYANQLMYYKP
jgi:predicted aldo/keto reductase-like oxidoreductase